ncbi:MAG: hypothetical protein GY780_10875 [bacterium]|nr:hypothetical protein [bacterium]
MSNSQRFLNLTIISLALIILTAQFSWALDQHEGEYGDAPICNCPDGLESRWNVGSHNRYGAGQFEDGEIEDYLLMVEDVVPTEDADGGTLKSYCP